MQNMQTATCEINAFGTQVAFHLPDPEDFIQKHILQRRAFYEQPMLEEIGPTVPENSLIIDVGANIGNHTLFFAKVLGTRVVAFEPHPTAVSILRTNIELNRLNDRVELHAIALGEGASTGTISDIVPNKMGMAQVVADKDGSVIISSLDSVIGERAVHLIKIDVEGMECDVLKGALETLNRSHPALLIEAATVDALAGVEAILRPLGYHKVKVYNHTPTYLFKHAVPIAAEGKSALSFIPSDVLTNLPSTTGVYAGMATVAGNEAALRATVMSLLPQVDGLYLYLNGFKEVPDFMRRYPKIKYFVDESGTQYGDAGKFWGLEQVKDAVYITCDDDIIYPPDFVEQMIRELAMTGGRSAHGVHGSLLLQPATRYYATDSRSVFHFQQNLMRRRLVHIAATNACIFHSSIVRMKLSDFRHPNMADIWLAQYLLHNGIPSYVAPRRTNWLIPIEINRPTIYEQSRQGSGTRYDSSKQQDKILSSMYPISLLQTTPWAPVFLLDVDESVDIAGLLSDINLGERDPVVIVVCENTRKALRNEIISKGIRWEVHLLPKSSPLPEGYRELLAGVSDRVRFWKIHSGPRPERCQDIDLGRWIDETFPAGVALAHAIAMEDDPIAKLQAPAEATKPAFDSDRYWEDRYKAGGNSGAGSYNRAAEYKSLILNSFVQHRGIQDIAEMGSGDGNQLGYFLFNRYTGFDVSKTAINWCRKKYHDNKTHRFFCLSEENFDIKDHYSKYDLSLSLDVIFHLIDDAIYLDYMEKLFSLSNKYVVVYASNYDGPDRRGAAHVRNRHFTEDVKRWFPEWKLLKIVDNPYKDIMITEADFFFFGKGEDEDISFIDAINTRSL